MLNDRKNIDNLFHHKLIDLEKDLPEYVWDNMYEELKKRKRKKRIIYFYRIAASFALLLSFGAGYFLNNNNDPGNTGISENIAVVQADMRPADMDNIPVNSTTDRDISKNIPAKSNTSLTESDNTEHTGNDKTPATDTEENTSYNTSIAEIINNADRGNSMKLQNTRDQQIEDIFAAGSDQKNEDQNNNDSEKKQLFIEQFFKNTATGNNRSLFVNQDNKYEKDLLALNNDKNPGKWSVGGRFSPTFVYGRGSGTRELKNSPSNSYDNSSSYINNLATNGESTSSGRDPVILTSGINVQYNIWKNCGLQSGLYYSKIGFSYKFLEVPFIVTYKVIDRQIDLNAIGGISPGILIGAHDVNESMMNYSSVTGLGLEYALSSKIALSIEPVIKYSIPLNQNYFTINHPLSFSVFTGVNYNF